MVPTSTLRVWYTTHQGTVRWEGRGGEGKKGGREEREGGKREGGRKGGREGGRERGREGEREKEGDRERP